MFANNVSNSLSQSYMFTALRKFLLLLVDVPVLQSQQNKVALPTGNFITMTSLGEDVKSTNRISYANEAGDPGSEIQQRTAFWRVQLDCFGSEAQSLASLISTAFRSEWACMAFKSLSDSIAPISGGDPRQTAFINSESEYEDRWTLEATLGIDKAVTLPQYFFTQDDVETYSYEMSQ
ncbi:LIC_12616 family protein [Rouxiella badensis]|uniref:phage neck terminator protein n=1 Tax=Rouxiella badensis TaxID=1646377 RepID=UPI0022AAB06A|nr:hypothetical protein [Rouxiella badensis]WAT10149.1 hypothetical protein O1V65_06185 [Rouxiella badensis]